MNWQLIDQVPEDGIVMIARRIVEGDWHFEVVVIDDGDFIFFNGLGMPKDIGRSMFSHFSFIEPPVMQ